MMGVAAAALSSSPPTGRWDGDLIGGAPSGHLGNPGHHVPLVGNGYLGMLLQVADLSSFVRAGFTYWRH